MNIDTIDCISIKDSNMHKYRAISNPELARLEKQIKIMRDAISYALSNYRIKDHETTLMLLEALEGSE